VAWIDLTSGTGEIMFAIDDAGNGLETLEGIGWGTLVG
jgi:hypothetical protein